MNTASKPTEKRMGVSLPLLLNADEFGTLRTGVPHNWKEGYPALKRAGYIVSCGVGYCLTALGREARAEMIENQAKATRLYYEDAKSYLYPPAKSTP
jgi:hypothetical protein